MARMPMCSEATKPSRQARVLCSKWTSSCRVLFFSLVELRELRRDGYLDTALVIGGPRALLKFRTIVIG